MQPGKIFIAADERFEYGEASASSFSWALLGRIASQVIQVISTIFLGRLIAPDEFGIFAAGAVLIALGQIFTDLGIGPAIVHQKTITVRFLETAFWLNASSGLILTVVSVAAAWPLAAWFGYSALHWVIPLEGTVFALSISTVGLALLERQFRFRTIAFVELAAMIVGQVTAIVIALVHPSVLALVLAPVVTAATLSILVNRAAIWRPSARPRFHRAEVRQLGGFSAFLSIFNVTSFAARNSDDFFVGRFVSATQLGFYSRSYQLMLLPVSQVTQALARVLLPAFAGSQADKIRLQRMYTASTVAAAAIGFPTAATFYAVAPSAIPIALGDKWQGMIPLFQLLSLSVPAQVLGTVNGPLYTATGNVKTLLYSGASSSGLLVVAFAATAPFGTIPVAVAFVVHSFVTLPIAIVPITRRLGLRYRHALGPICMVAASTTVLFAALEGMPAIAGFDQGSMARLGTQLLSAIVLGCVAYFLLRRMKIIERLRDVLAL